MAMNQNTAWLGIAAIGGILVSGAAFGFAFPGRDYVTDVPGYLALLVLGGYIAFGGAM